MNSKEQVTPFVKCQNMLRDVQYYFLENLDEEHLLKAMFSNGLKRRNLLLWTLQQLNPSIAREMVFNDDGGAKAMIDMGLFEKQECVEFAKGSLSEAQQIEKWEVLFDYVNVMKYADGADIEEEIAIQQKRLLSAFEKMSKDLPENGDDSSENEEESSEKGEDSSEKLPKNDCFSDLEECDIYEVCSAAKNFIKELEEEELKNETAALKDDEDELARFSEVIATYQRLKCEVESHAEEFDNLIAKYSHLIELSIDANTVKEVTEGALKLCEIQDRIDTVPEIPKNFLASLENLQDGEDGGEPLHLEKEEDGGEPLRLEKEEDGGKPLRLEKGEDGGKPLRLESSEDGGKPLRLESSEDGEKSLRLDDREDDGKLLHLESSEDGEKSLRLDDREDDGKLLHLENSEDGEKPLRLDDREDDGKLLRLEGGYGSGKLLLMEDREAGEDIGKP